MEEVKAFAEAKAKEDAPLSTDEMGKAAGGFMDGMDEKDEVYMSVFTFGIGCGFVAAISHDQAVRNGTHHVGKREGDKGRLCNSNK